MGLNNAQYDAIRRIYDLRQQEDRRRTAERHEEIYQKLPELRAISEALSNAGVNCTRRYIHGDRKARSELSDRIEELKLRRKKILTDNGYPEDYLRPVYVCSDCQDTGYLPDGSKCHCFMQEEIRLIYGGEEYERWFSEQNFDTFSLDYYDADLTDPLTGMTSLESAQNAFSECKSFVKNFKNQGGNIILNGNTGVGKTFLSNCIAGALLQAGYTVLYVTSSRLFDLFQTHVFDHQNPPELSLAFAADLLVIDDLGTETSNSFTIQSLFRIVNERLLKHKSTVISTNLSIQDLQELYTERFTSRIAENYSFIRLYGRDIRFVKKNVSL